MGAVDGSRRANVRPAVLGVCLLGALLSGGCDSWTRPGPEPAGVQPSRPAPPRVFPEGRARVEFGSARANWLTPEILQFEIPYRFTAGGPRHVYTCSIDFPGTTARGATPLTAGELDLEGVIKTRIAVGEADVNAFRIEMYEAVSLESQYDSISDPAAGEVPPRPEEFAIPKGQQAGS